MISVENLIYNALVSGKSVNLAGVGSLALEFHAAKQIDKKTVSAPSTHIVFSPKEHSYGVDIVESIAREAECDMTAAKEMYDEWLAKSKVGDKISIEGVGSIDNDTFFPSEELFNTLNPLKRANAVIRRGKGGLITWLIATPLWIVAGLVVAYSLGWIKADLPFFGKESTSQIVVADPEPVDATIFEEEDSSEVVTSTEMTVEPEVETEAVAPAEDVIAGALIDNSAPETERTGQYYQYYVIAGVFSTEENADRFISESGDKYWEAALVKLDLPSGKIMVALYGSDSRDEANAHRGKYSSVDRNLWVWKSTL